MWQIYFNIIDILLLSYIAIAGVYLVLQNEFCSFDIAKWGVFLLCYFVVRNIRHKQWCLWGIVLLGIIEAVITIYQKVHWIDNFYSIFNVTGTFANPGPLGGFIAIVMTITLGLYLEYRKYLWIKYFLFSILMLLLAIVIQTESRAGWLAVLLGVGSFFFYEKKRGRYALNNFQKVSLLILVTLFFISIYYYKKDSADGRLLIWRVSSEMIADAPLIGHGIGSFGRLYMFYQARYFEAHPYSQYVRLVDNIAYPYNEFLRIGVELGIIGLALAIGIIVCVFKYVAYRRNNKIYLGAFISWIIFTMFSYPSHVLLLWLLLPILLGGMQCRNSICVQIGYKFKLIGWMIGFVCLAFIMHSGYDYCVLKNNVKQLYSSSPQEIDEATLYVEQHRLELQSLPQLFDIYAQYSNHNYPLPKRKIVLEAAATIIPTSDLYCDLGDTYKELKQVNKAIECYVLAGNMVPNRISPNYKLFCLYREAGDTVQMRKVGLKALNAKIKVESTETLCMKGDLKRTLQ